MLFPGRFHALVLDCDGVVVDSEPSSVRAWTLALARYDHVATGEEIGSFIGTTERHLAEHYGPLVGVSADEMERAAREEFIGVVTSEGVPAYADASALTERALAGGLVVGVGSNSFRWRLDAVLDAAGLSDRYPVSVAGDEVARPKPHPDVYRRVAEMLGVAPARTVVVEDTPTGVVAARAAGCSVVAVARGLVDRTLLAGADLVVDGLEDIDRL
jgi:beta-phosphoglucomutase-like phosphatase (HAD superfamily)